MRKALLVMSFILTAAFASAQTVAIPPNVLIGSEPWSFPVLATAADTAGTQHLLITSKATNPPLGWHGNASTSTNSGVIWANDSINSPGFGNDPWCCMDSTGDAFLVTDANVTYFSSNFGVSWAIRGAYASLPSLGQDHMSIAENTAPGSAHWGDIYVLWAASWLNGTDTMTADSGFGGILFAKSTDQGETFSTPVVISAQSPGDYSQDRDYCYDPQIICANGVLYATFTISPADSEYVMTSADAGTTWNEYSAVPSYVITSTIHQTTSLAASPVNANAIFAMETPTGLYYTDGIPKSTYITVAYTVDSGSTWATCSSHVGSGKYPVEPTALIDSNGVFYVSFYGSSNGGLTYSNYYLDYSSNNGSSWSEIVVNTDPFAMQDTAEYSFGTAIGDYGGGAWQGMAITGQNTVGLCWADNRNNTIMCQCWYANIPFGTQFYNQFSQTYDAFNTNLINAKQSTPTVTDTIASSGLRLLTKDTNYIVKSDSLRHFAYGDTRNNYEFYRWNTLVSTLYDSLSHVYSGTGSKPSWQIANFNKIDSLKLFNNFCDTTGDSIQWSVDTSSYQKVHSIFTMDTAFDGLVKFYNFIAKPTITFNGTWTFDRWSTGLTSDTLTLFEFFGDTTVEALYTSPNKSDAAGQLYPSQRKICFDSAYTKFWRVTSIYSDILLQYSTNNGCTWSTAQQINAAYEYGHSINPSICVSEPDTTMDSSLVFITWEDSAAVGGAVSRTIHYFYFYGAENTPLTSGYTADSIAWNGSYSFTDAKPAAPMCCAAYKGNWKGFRYGRFEVAWSNGSSLCIAAEVPWLTFTAGCTPLMPPPDTVPGSAGGYFPAIEAGFNNSPDADAIDFNLTWHDNAGLNYKYLDYNCYSISHVSTFYNYYYQSQAAANEIAPYFTYVDTTGDYFSTNTFGSLAVAAGAEPIVSMQNISSWLICHPIGTGFGAGIRLESAAEGSIVTRMKQSHSAANWGGEQLISRYYANESVAPNAFLNTPSVTAYPDSSDYKLFFHILNNGKDTIQYVNAPLTPPSGDTSYKTIHLYTVGRAPFQPFYRSLSYYYTFYGFPLPKNITWSKDSVGTHNVETATTITDGTSCPPPSISGPSRVITWAYTDAMVHYTDSALIKFAMGEMAYSGTSGAFAIAQKPMNPTTPIDSIADAEKQMHTQYIHIADDTAWISGMYMPMLTDSLQTPRAIGAGMLQFRVELRDSATDTVVKILDTIGIIATSPYVSGTTGMDTAVVIGHNGETTFIQISVDTINAPHTVTVIPAQEISETQLSAFVASDSGGMAKQINPERQVGLLSTPINLTSAPNPFYPRSDISFTVPQSESGYPVQVKVFSTDGRCVATLVNAAQMQAGRFTVTLDGTNLPTAEYIVRVMEHDYQQNGILVLMK